MSSPMMSYETEQPSGNLLDSCGQDGSGWTTSYLLTCLPPSLPCSSFPLTSVSLVLHYPNKVLTCMLLTRALFPGHPSLRQKLSYLVNDVRPKHLAVSISDRCEQIQRDLDTCRMLLSWWHRLKLLVHQPKIVSTRYNQFSRVFCSIQLDDMQDGIRKNFR